jgi:hypothetical protein
MIQIRDSSKFEMKIYYENLKFYEFFLLLRCEECGRPFTQKVHLRKHIEKHHPNLVVD